MEVSNNQPNHTKTYQLVINQTQLALKPVATNMDMDAIVGGSTSHLKHPHEEHKEDCKIYIIS